MKIGILARDDPSVAPFDTATVKTEGLAGSEEAIVYLALEFAERKHHVTVFAKPPPGAASTEPTSNPRFLNAAQLEEHSKVTTFDILILWRRADFEHILPHQAKHVYYWPHDIPEPHTPEHDSFVLPPNLTGILYISKYIRYLYESSFPALRSCPNVICGNGILVPAPIASILNADNKSQPQLSQGAPLSKRQEKVAKRQNKSSNDVINRSAELFPILNPKEAKQQLDIENLFAVHKTNPQACVYISNWSRGLELLLMIWPAVKDKCVNATLDIYYGEETWGIWNAEQTKHVKEQIQKLQPLGVTSHGMVTHSELDKALLKASVLAYPCITATETYCISVMKAQVLGVIPVITMLGALPETIYLQAPCIPAIDPLNITIYTNLLITTLCRLQHVHDKTPLETWFDWKPKQEDTANTAQISKLLELPEATGLPNMPQSKPPQSKMPQSLILPVQEHEREHHHMCIRAMLDRTGYVRFASTHTWRQAASKMLDFMIKQS